LSLDRRALIASGAVLAANIAVGPAMARAAKALYPADGDMVMGSAGAPVQLVVFASASCPHCAHWWTTVLPGIKKTYIDTGKVKLVFREFLTEPPSFAAAGFLLSRSVPGKYFEVLGTVFAKQAEIYQSGKLYEGLLAIGKSFGLTEDQFAAVLSDKKTLDALNARVELAAVRDKVDVTPTFFVAGKHMPDDVSPAQLTAALAAAVKG
jgi:protein-disulfide isomerase